MSFRQSFISTYLDSPIIKNERDRFYLSMLQVRSGEKTKLHPSKTRKIREMLALTGDSDVLTLDPLLYPSFDKVLSPVDHINELEESSELAQLVFNQASKGAEDWGIRGGLGVHIASISALSPLAKRWYNCHRMFRSLIDKVSCANALGSKHMVSVREGNLFIMSDCYLGLIKIDEIEDWYLVTYEQLLMFKDMYYGRFNASYACLQIYRDPHLQETIELCLDWFMKCVGIYGNKGYEIGKQIEPLAKANLIRLTDSVLGENGSYDDMLKTIRKKETGQGASTEFLIDELDHILKREIEASKAVELFGLQKLSGHPLIDPSVGGDSVIREARTKMSYSQTNINRLRNNFCRLYLEGYLKRQSEWPPLVFARDSRQSKLYQLYSLREMRISHDTYPLSDWEGVRFGKHHDFDYYPNFTDLMDDKAISFYRNEAAATWDRRISTRSHKRLLIEMLRRPDISIREIIDRVRAGDIPYSWTIVSLYPKEREFKIEARMFSMMVFEMRAFFTATEANLAEHVFPNLPQQTMTLQKQEIQELFHKVTNTASGEELERLFLEIDLTRWNLRWHPEPIDPIGRDLEDMFDMNGVYTVVHHFFRTCMIMVRVNSCEPQGISTPHPPETSLLWYNHEVGFEGIAQKLWTCATYSMIDLGMIGFQGKYYLIGQGDNQIVLTSIDCSSTANRPELLRSSSKKITLGIEKECKKVGQEAKPEECLQSTCVVTYGKDVFINGVEHFTSIKAASRMFPHSASDFPSIDNSIGAISGQSIACAEKMKQPMNAFALWCFHTALYLTHLSTMSPVESIHLSSAFKARFTLREKYGLMILPGDLGGAPIAPITSFFYKGSADPLSKSYASLKFYQNQSPLARKMIWHLHEGSWFEDAPDKDRLLEDPYGLPLKRPTTAESSVLQPSKEKVRGITKNRALKELTSLEVEGYEVELRKALLLCVPLNPVLLSDVLGWSVAGAKKTIARMFTSTRTIQSLLQGDETVNPCNMILESGTGHFLNTIERIRHARTGERRIDSVYNDVTAMRSKWFEEKESSIAGTTAYTPFDLPLVISSSPIARPGFKAYLNVNEGCDIFHSRGSSDPYLGRATVEKRADHGYRIITSSAPERAVKRLADIATQPGVGLSFKNLISIVAESRANVDLDAVYPMIGYSIGGTIAHRYRSRYGIRSASGLGSLSIASNCFLSNDTAYPISGGERDVQIMIQEEMVCQIGIFQVISAENPRSLFTCLCTDTINWEFLDDSVLEAPSDLTVPVLRLEGNVIATANFIELKRTHGPAESPFSSPLLSVGSNDYHRSYALRRLVGRSLRSSNSALLIADMGSGSLYFKMDILELRGCGILEVLRCMSAEVASLAVEAIFARSSGELRWTPIPLIASVSEALARSISPIIGHPMFKNDEYVARHLYLSPLKYEFASQNPVKKICTSISTQAIEMFSSSRSQIFTDPDVVFSDDAQDSVSRAVIRKVKLMFYQSVAIGECPPAVAYSAIRRTLPATIRSEVTEHGRLNALYRMVVGLTSWARERAYPILHEQLESLHQGSAVRSCHVAAPELLRNSRQYYSLNLISQGTKIQFDLSNTQESKFLSEWHIDGTSRPFARLEDQDEVSHNEYQSFSTRRMIGREYGAESSVGYSYVPIIGITSSRVCVLVGCGFGTGASVILKHGASHVFGLDLWSDCIPSRVMNSLTIPASIQATGFSWAFTRIDTSPQETGNITDPRTSHLISQYCGIGSLIIIDAPIISQEDLSSMIATLSLLQSDTETLFRFLGPRNNYDIITATLCTSCINVASISVYEEEDYLEAWIHFYVPPVPLLSGVKVDRRSSIRISLDQTSDLRFLGGGREYLLSLLSGPYGLVSEEQIADGISASHKLIAASIGDLEHRFTYNQWTDVVHAYVYSMVLESDNPLAFIEEILLEDEITLTVHDHIIPISVSKALRRNLTRILPRVLIKV